MMEGEHVQLQNDLPKYVVWYALPGAKTPNGAMSRFLTFEKLASSLFTRADIKSASVNHTCISEIQYISRNE